MSLAEQRLAILMKEAAKVENERARKAWGGSNWGSQERSKENGRLGGRPAHQDKKPAPKKQPRPFSPSMLKPKPAPKPKPKPAPKVAEVKPVEQAMPKTNFTDRVGVVDRMLARNWSVDDIADVLGVSVDVVEFLRLEFGLPTKKG